MKITTHSKTPTLFIVLLLLLSGCRNSRKNIETEKSNSPAKNLFALVSAEQLGMDKEKLETMEMAINTGEYPNIHSVLIAKDNQLVYENYFKGKDEIWGTDLGEIEHDKNQLHDVRSVSKTIVSLCTGILIKQGRLESVNQKVSGFFPESLSAY